MQALDFTSVEKSQDSAAPGFDKSERERADQVRDLGWALLLVAVAFLCFGNSLKGFFYCDDFWHLGYLYQVFSHHPEWLLRNFVGVWMDNDVLFKFYRPLTEMSFALDYLLWTGNPLGYHITNLFWHATCSIILFALSRKLVASFGVPNASAIGMLASLLFAIYPLNVEAINWIVGRADPICISFYFAAMWLFLKAFLDKDKGAAIISLFAFAAALLSKEMAVSLPAVIAFYGFLSPSRNDDLSWKDRLRAAFNCSRNYWIVVVSYVLLRWFALGTIFGGYQGSIDHFITPDAIVRGWISGNSFNLLVHPINHFAFGKGGGLFERLLSTLYLIATLSIIYRWSSGLWHHGVDRCFVFLSGWFVLQCMPLYKLWMTVSPDLLQARVMYLSTAIWCLVLTLVIVPTSNHRSQSKDKKLVAQCVAGFLVAGFVALFFQISARNTEVWLRASAQIVALKNQTLAALSKLPERQSILLTPLPYSVDGGRMLTFYTQVRDLFSPPLCNANVASRVATLEPGFTIPTDMINVSRLRKELTDKRVRTFYWDSHNQQLKPVTAASSLSPMLELPVKQLNQGTWSPMYHSDFNPVDWDFVEVLVKATPAVDKASASPDPRPNLWVCWDNLESGKQRTLSASLCADGQMHEYRFPVSQYQDWTLCDRLRLRLYTTSPWHGDIIISRVRLLNAASSLPVVSADDATAIEGLDGAYQPKGAVLNLNYDVSKIPGAAKAIVEIGEKNSYFEHYSGTLRESYLSSHAIEVEEHSSLKGRITLKTKDLSEPGWYQVRISAVSANGNVVGYCSDPLYLSIPAK